MYGCQAEEPGKTSVHPRVTFGSVPGDGSIDQYPWHIQAFGLAGSSTSMTVPDFKYLAALQRENQPSPARP